MLDPTVTEPTTKFISDLQPACLPVSLPCDESHFNQMSQPQQPFWGIFFGNQETSEEESEEVAHCDADALDFVRSTPFCGNSLFGREQKNDVTAYVDASNVYGSAPDVADELRTHSYGLMKTSDNELLPQLISNDNEFTAGDTRAREMPGLAAMHTVWLREHNRIAHWLKADYGYTGDEEIYQLARRIVGAEMQNVVYGQWLTAVLGEDMMQEKGLSLHGRSTYDPSADASIFNAFATAAFR